jgi:phage virion morphogenesis protein
MAAASVSFDLKEIEAVKKLLANAALDGAARSRLLQSIGNEIKERTQDRFDTKTSPDGDTWKAIAEKTRRYYESKPKLSSAEPPLVLEGMLRLSLTSEVQDGAWSTLVGATMEYAAVHQFGWPEKNIPARPYLGVSQDDAKVIEAAVSVFLEGTIK